jgi:hypothetical protein
VVEENASEYLRAMLGKEFHTGKDAMCSYSGAGSPFFNGVFNARLTGSVDGGNKMNNRAIGCKWTYVGLPS